MSELTVVFDASAYRALTRDGETLRDAAGVRELGRSLADAARAAGGAAASPFTLWALLADVASAAPSAVARRRRAPSEADHQRGARARLALAACAAHCRAGPNAPGAHGFALAPDPDTTICRVIGREVPREVTAWAEYLASVASEIAAEPTAERAQRLAGPLAHVGERARSVLADFRDEMQDAVLGAYDTASTGWGWDADTSDDARQAALASPLGTALPDDGGTLGEPLMLALLRRDPLLRAVADGRVARAHAVIARATGAAHDVETQAPPTPDETAAVAEAFPAGVALGRELLRRVIAGDLEVAEGSARRWLWDLQIALGLTADALGVTGNAVLGEAVQAGVQGLETLPAYRARLAR